MLDQIFGLSQPKLRLVEVKRPGKVEEKSILENKIVLGQLYDYMLQLHSYHGLQNVFGIVATYNEWRICWLPEVDTAARAISISMDKEEKNRMLDPALDIEEMNDQKEKEDTEVTEDLSSDSLG